MSSTPRDQIYEVIHTYDGIRLTVQKVRDEADEDLSRYTVRHALNGLSEVGVLKHKSGSEYWYIT